MFDASIINNKEYSVTFTVGEPAPMVTGATLLDSGEGIALNKESAVSVEKAGAISAQVDSSVREAGYAICSAEVNAETGEWEPVDELASGAMSINGFAYAEFDEPITFNEDSKYIVTITAKDADENTEATNFCINGTFDVNQAAADAVVEKINAIGTVEYTEACKTLIDAAREAYDALTEDQKALITAEQYQVLTDAEEEYERLKEITTGIYGANATGALKDGKFFDNSKVVIVKNNKVYNTEGNRIK